MFIAHLPAAYLATRLFARNSSKVVLAAVLLGGVAPDLDMIWFYWGDGAVHHHRFLTHRPALWLGLWLIGLGMMRAFSRPVGPLVAGFGAGGVVHMFLDSVTGQIAWFWPISDRFHTLVVVPATQNHWMLSFLLHWTFLLELGLCALALILFKRLNTKEKPGHF